MPGMQQLPLQQQLALTEGTVRLYTDWLEVGLPRNIFAPQNQSQLQNEHTSFAA